MRFKQRVHAASEKHRARAAWHDKFLWLPTRITHSADEERRVQEGALRTDRA